MDICIDFDGTIVKHDYPAIGDLVPHAIETMKDLIKNGHRLILFTMRSNVPLTEAVDFLKANGVELYGVNANPTQRGWTHSPKAYAQIYIDDAALGCPLVTGDERAYVDWLRVRLILKQKGCL